MISSNLAASSFELVNTSEEKSEGGGEKERKRRTTSRKRRNQDEVMMRMAMEQRLLKAFDDLKVKNYIIHHCSNSYAHYR